MPVHIDVALDKQSNGIAGMLKELMCSVYCRNWKKQISKWENLSPYLQQRYVLNFMQAYTCINLHT